MYGVPEMAGTTYHEFSIWTKCLETADKLQVLLLLTSLPCQPFRETFFLFSWESLFVFIHEFIAKLLTTSIFRNHDF